MPDRDTVRFVLRRATAACHARVDRAYSKFDLDDPASYAGFLTAHARLLGPLETVLRAAELWPEWVGRRDLLHADLAAMGCTPPPAMAVPQPVEAGERWGMLYVLEGSRLGGAMLARQVGAGMPTAYLDAGHRGGSWARFGDAIDRAAADGGRGWTKAAIAGAERTFALFEQAAGAGRTALRPQAMEVMAGVVGAAGIEPATPPV